MRHAACLVAVLCCCLGTTSKSGMAATPRRPGVEPPGKARFVSAEQPADEITTAEGTQSSDVEQAYDAILNDDPFSKPPTDDVPAAETEPTPTAVPKVPEAVRNDNPFVEQNPSDEAQPSEEEHPLTDDNSFEDDAPAADSAPDASFDEPVTIDEIGIVNISDGRLPPAAPLGATNPFGRARYRSEMLPDEDDANAASDSPFQNVSRSRKVDLEALPVEPDGVDQSDMVRRPIWGVESRPHPTDSRTTDYTIIPRRPFLTEERLRNERPVSVTANRPVELLPDGSVENFETAVLDPATKTDAAPATIEETQVADQPPKDDATDMALAPEPPLDEELLPTADPAFAETAPVFADETPASRKSRPAPKRNGPRGPTLAAASGGPTLAPPPGQAAPAPPQVAESVTATPSALAIHSGHTSVTPIVIDEADASAKTNSSKQRISRPVAIGLVLAFVATSVVIIRRRFA